MWDVWLLNLRSHSGISAVKTNLEPIMSVNVSAVKLVSLQGFFSCANRGTLLFPMATVNMEVMGDGWLIRLKTGVKMKSDNLQNGCICCMNLNDWKRQVYSGNRFFHSSLVVSIHEESLTAIMLTDFSLLQITVPSCTKTSLVKWYLVWSFYTQTDKMIICMVLLAAAHSFDVLKLHLRELQCADLFIAVFC